MFERSPRVDEALLRSIGERSAPFFEPGARWLHRRVESVAWIDDRIWRRKVSVDFTIPDRLPVVHRRGGRDLFYVPVASLQKWRPLLGLDLQARGLPTHLLTSTVNGAIDEALLYSLARRTMGTLLAPSVREQVRLLATETDASAASDAYHRIEAAMPSWLDREERRRFLALAATMIRANLLWFPVLGHRGERHVVKFSYDEEIQLKSSGFWRQLAAGLSWSPHTTWIELDHLGDQGSYHVDVSAPEGLSVGHQPRLFFVTESDGADDTDDETLLDMQPIGQRLHAYVKASRPGKAFLSVPVAAARHGFVSGALVASFGVTLMLLFFWRWSAQMANDTAASVAILVVVPVLLGYIAVRPVAHPVAVRQVARVRDLLMISGGLSVFTAIGLVHFAELQSPGCVRTLCRNVFYAEFVVLALILVSYLRSRSA